MVDGLEEVGGDVYVDGDLRFHLAIAEASRNRLVLHSMHAVRDVLRRALVRPFRSPRAPRRSLQQHRSIRDAIAARDAERARAEMREHLTSVEADVRGAVVFEVSVAELGYIGLGVMGGGITRRLLAAGHT